MKANYCAFTSAGKDDGRKCPLGEVERKGKDVGKGQGCVLSQAKGKLVRWAFMDGHSPHQLPHAWGIGRCEQSLCVPDT